MSQNQRKRLLRYIGRRMEGENNESLNDMIANLFNQEGQDRIDEIEALIIRRYEWRALLSILPFMIGYAFFVNEWIINWSPFWVALVPGVLAGSCSWVGVKIIDRFHEDLFD